MEDYSKKQNSRDRFSSDIAVGLLQSVPFAKNPIEAILFHAEMLLVESGMSEPPFSPSKYAPLRSVNEVLFTDMKVDGRLIPCADGFKIELRRDRPKERINFTFAHELGHTFFYEAVPSIKYRTTQSNSHQYDEDEEKLCNIAASELLMPTSIISKIAKDFIPSPQSLVKIAKLFETSLTATIVKLLSLNLWNANFVLWKFHEEKMKAEWLATPNRGLKFNPNIELVNYTSTSIHHTFLKGETCSDFEWLIVNGGFSKKYFNSIKLNSKTVLTCITNTPINSSKLLKENNENNDLINNSQLNSICRCDGTGWYSIRQNGMRYAVRCRAYKHRIPPK